MNSCPTCGLAYPADFTLCPRDGAKLVEVGVWSEGTVVRGKYRILGKVGQGGMATVYKALHLRFGEVRALKVISQELAADATFVKRFEHEAVITRKLQHPNAVRVDDIDEAEDGRPFIVMEFIDGANLKKLIQSQSPLPVSRVCSIIEQAASALDAAHRLGIVHRDIKPDNIVLVETPEGEQAKILDFGIAKVKEARLGGETSGMTLTGTGVVVGTPQYMSPEQAAGKRGDEIDGRSDIYSLGIVMYQMLTGELPYKAATTMEMVLAHIQTPPAPIRTLRPNLQIPEPIAKVVMRCLEKDRDLRPAGAKVLIEELERAKTEKGTAPAATRPVRPGKARSRRSEQSPLPAQGSPGSRAVVSATPASREPSPTVLSRPPAPTKISQPRQAASPAQPREPLPASSPRWGVWASISIAVVALAFGGWYFGRGSSGTPTAQPETAPPQPVVAPASQTVTPALARPEKNTGQSRIGGTVPQPAQPGVQAGLKQTAPATNRRVAARSLSTPGTTVTPTPVSPAPTGSVGRRLDTGDEKALGLTTTGSVGPFDAKDKSPVGPPTNFGGMHPAEVGPEGVPPAFTTNWRHGLNENDKKPSSEASAAPAPSTAPTSGAPATTDPCYQKFEWADYEAHLTHLTDCFLKKNALEKASGRVARSISGTVMDESGAVIPGTIVSCVDGNREAFSTSTNFKGRYKVHCPTNADKVIFYDPWFHQTEYAGNRMTVSHIDAVLKVGSSSEIIEIK
ncbi:MAG: protein kinase [Candidatus Sulfotelmatobacter sp.]